MSKKRQTNPMARLVQFDDKSLTELEDIYRITGVWKRSQVIRDAISEMHSRLTQGTAIASVSQ